MSEILDIAHELARDLFKVGAMDEITMHKMDVLCLPTKRPLKPEDIRRIRKANQVSQAVLQPSWALARRPCNSGSRAKRNQAAPRSVFSILLTVKDWPRLANRAVFSWPVFTP